VGYRYGFDAEFKRSPMPAGLHLSATVEVEGTVIESRGHLALMNPKYTPLPTEHAPPASPPRGAWAHGPSDDRSRATKSR
jgi:hypothetical protein